MNILVDNSIEKRGLGELLFRNLHQTTCQQILAAFKIAAGFVPEGYEWVNKLNPPDQRKFTIELTSSLVAFITRQSLTDTGDHGVSDVCAVLENWEYIQTKYVDEIRN